MLFNYQILSLNFIGHNKKKIKSSNNKIDKNKLQFLIINESATHIICMSHKLNNFKPVSVIHRQKHLNLNPSNALEH